MKTKKNDKFISTATVSGMSALLGHIITWIAVCVPHYMTMESAPFHFELGAILEDDNYPLIEVIGFRGSSKTTFASLATPLQFALSGKYKFIVIINDTAEQVKGNLFNIKTELENNAILKKMYPNVRLGRTWSNFNLLIEVKRADGTIEIIRIIGRSRGQNIRGSRHKQYRPDCIIVDDPENTLQVKTKESRDATEAWFNGEVIPAAQENNSKLIVIGNFLHNDGFMARLAKNTLFKVIRIPFFREDGTVQWKAKYPTQAHVDRQRQKVGETAWSREYLLKVVSPEDQVIKETDIKKYPNDLLTKHDDFGRALINIEKAGVGNDLAISLKESADYTTMVAGYKVTLNAEKKILIKPDPVNKHMDFDTTIKTAKNMIAIMPIGTMFYVEDVGYQKAAIQTMERERIPVVPMRPVSDKRARLESVAPYIKSGYVMFPEKGCEDLIQQLIGFGTEEHDDLVDALVYLIMGLINSRSSYSGQKVDQL